MVDGPQAAMAISKRRAMPTQRATGASHESTFRILGTALSVFMGRVVGTELP
jgi:hypothetical protein